MREYYIYYGWCGRAVINGYMSIPKWLHDHNYMDHSYVSDDVHIEDHLGFPVSVPRRDDTPPKYKMVRR